MLIKYLNLVFLFVFIIVFSSCSQKEINKKDYIIQDINVIKSQLNEIKSKSNLFKLSYKDLNNYNNEFFIKLNTFNNKFLFKLDNEFVLFKNKIIDIENKFSKINKYIIQERNNKKQLDINKIKEELLLTKEKLLKININHVEQIAIIKFQNEKLIDFYNNYSKDKMHLEKKIDRISSQFEIYESSIFRLNSYLKNDKQDKKQIKIEFLVVLVGFYGAIIAFLIPHGIDMISKISKLYESEVVTDLFREKAHVNRLHLNLLIAVVYNVLLIFKYNYLTYPLLLISLIHFLIIIYFVMQYINKLNFYTNIDAILNSIQEDITNEIQ